MDDPLVLWSKVLRGMAVITLALAFGGWLLISGGFLVVSWDDLGGESWRPLLGASALALLLWLASCVLSRLSRRRK